MRPYSTLPNRYSTTIIFPTTTQPLSNPAPTIGNLNPSTTVLQPLVGLGHAKPSSNHPTTTLQPSFVSNPRTIPTQPSHIRDSPTSTAKQRGRTAAHQSPLHAKCNLIRGKMRRARSNAPQRFEASSWATAAPSLCRERWPASRNRQSCRRGTNPSESQGRLQGGAFAVHRPRRCRVAA